MDIRFSSDSPTRLSTDALVVCATSAAWRDDLASFDAAFDGGLLTWLDKQNFTGKGGAVLVPTFGKLSANAILVIGVGSGDEISRAAGFARAGRKLRTSDIQNVAIVPATLDASTAVEQLLAGNYQQDRYLEADDRRAPVSAIVISGTGSKEAVAAAATRAVWQDWCRDLVNMPAGELYPDTLAAAAVDRLGSLDHVEVDVWDWARCQRENLVGVIAVGQGSAKKGCLIHVRYKPPGATRHLAFVGKGVTFDSGGLSLKPSASMQTMRCDMGGAATVLAATGAVASLNLPVELDCWVGAVENMTGGNSYKLGDILSYNNGVTVEIHNTDAEGRLVLADALIQACKTPGVEAVVDAATLTGASMVALGEDFSALYSDHDTLAAELEAAAASNHEYVWRMPLHKAYKRKLKGSWSQIKNIGGRMAGATTAALFLQHFVTDDVEWAHLDIAGASFTDAGDSQWAPGATGAPVRTLISWVQDRVQSGE